MTAWLTNYEGGTINEIPSTVADVDTMDCWTGRSGGGIRD